MDAELQTRLSRNTACSSRLHPRKVPAQRPISSDANRTVADSMWPQGATASHILPSQLESRPCTNYPQEPPQPTHGTVQGLHFQPDPRGCHGKGPAPLSPESFAAGRSTGILALHNTAALLSASSHRSLLTPHLTQQAQALPRPQDSPTWASRPVSHQLPSPPHAPHSSHTGPCSLHRSLLCSLCRVSCPTVPARNAPADGAGLPPFLRLCSVSPSPGGLPGHCSK